MIDKGLSTEVKEVLITWTINKREIIKIICLELMVGFSFLETSIKNPQLISTSVKVMIQEIKSGLSKVGTRSIWKDEVMEIKIDIRKIINLSILEIWIGGLIDSWLLFQKFIIFFRELKNVCTEYD